MKRTVEQIKEDAQHIGIMSGDIGESMDEIEKAGFRNNQFYLLHKNPIERLRLLGNLFAQVNMNHFDDELRMEFGQLSGALSYLLNCSSFEDGKLHDFDKKELDRKLGRNHETHV